MKNKKWIIPVVIGTAITGVIASIVYDDLWARKHLNAIGYDGDDDDYDDDSYDEDID